MSENYVNEKLVERNGELTDMVTSLTEQLDEANNALEIKNEECTVWEKDFDELNTMYENVKAAAEDAYGELDKARDYAESALSELETAIK